MTKKELLRKFHINTKEFSDLEITEILKSDMITRYENLDFSNDYEYAGNYILTKDLEKFGIAQSKMCCGIYTDTFRLKSGKYIYFGFDYGH